MKDGTNVSACFTCACAWIQENSIKENFKEKKLNEYLPTLIYGKLSIKISVGKKPQQGFTHKR